MAKTDLKQFLSRTIVRVLEPVSRIAIRGEISFKEFSEAAKQAYFRVVREDYGVSGRKTNLSRVAILTGFSRKECARLKSIEEEQLPLVGEATNPCAKVISAWHNEVGYVNSKGVPAVLKLEGKGPNLKALIKEHAGDVPSGAILKELIRTGVVKKLKNDKYKVTRRNFIPLGFDEDKVRILGNQLQDLGDTIVFNLVRTKNEKSRLQRYVVNDAIPDDLVNEFQLYATEQSQKLLEELDLWLSEREELKSSRGNEKVNKVHRVGIGVYFFDDKVSRGNSS